MIRLYKYLYFRLYTWNLKKHGKKDQPQWNALFGVSFMMYLNIGIIAAILDMLGVSVFIEDTPKIEIAIFAFFILFANYFWLLHKEKYKLLAMKYKNESERESIRNMWLLCLYIIFSFFIIGVLGVIAREVTAS